MIISKAPQRLLAPQAKNRMPMQVPVALDDKVPTDEEAIKALEQAGCIHVRKEYLSSLNRLGVYAKGVGVLKNQRGAALVTQAGAFQLLQALNGAVEKITSKKKLNKSDNEMLGEMAKNYGYLMSKMTESLHFMLEAEGDLAQGPLGYQDGPRRPTFGAGDKVEPGATVVYSQNTQIVQGKNEIPTTPINPDVQKEDCQKQP